MIITGQITLSGGVTFIPEPPVSQQAFTTPGTFSWVAPLNVTSVGVVAVGGGGGGSCSNFGVQSSNGGGGGGLGWKNCIPVVSNKDKGWWLLVQYHKNHGFISMCVADNGIGIRNSLLTGPQKNDILSSIGEFKGNDGLYIKHAMKENVSGAALHTARGYRSLGRW